MKTGERIEATGKGSRFMVKGAIDKAEGFPAFILVPLTFNPG